MSTNGMPAEDAPRCNGRLRSNGSSPDEKAEPGEWAGEGYCQRVAGEGTDHKGEGRCKLHAGNAGRPPTHGLFSGRRDALQEKFEEAFGDDRIGSMRAQIAALKALQSEFWERIDTVDGEVLDAYVKLQGELRKTINTASQIQDRHAPSEQEVERLVTGFAALIDRYVDDSEQTDALRELRSLAGSDRPRSLESGGDGE